MKLGEGFSRFAHRVTDRICRPGAFFAASGVIVLWLFSGSYFHYSAVWVEIINTVLAVVTFLLVLLLQHSQNHDTRVIQLKLDELIRSHARATNDLIEAEKLTETEVESIKHELRKKTG